VLNPSHVGRATLTPALTSNSSMRYRLNYSVICSLLILFGCYMIHRQVELLLDGRLHPSRVEELLSEARETFGI